MNDPWMERMAFPGFFLCNLNQRAGLPFLIQLKGPPSSMGKSLRFLHTYLTNIAYWERVYLYCSVNFHNSVRVDLSACIIKGLSDIGSSGTDPLALPENILYERYMFSSGGIHYLIVLVGPYVDNVDP